MDRPFRQVGNGHGPPRRSPKLVRVVGEKLPFEALHAMGRSLEFEGIPRNGVYIAHDSMGDARYIGRGSIFTRLLTRQKAQILELKYFSFYVVEQKKHEREIEELFSFVQQGRCSNSTPKRRESL